MNKNDFRLNNYKGLEIKNGIPWTRSKTDLNRRPSILTFLTKLYYQLYVHFHKKGGTDPVVRAQSKSEDFSTN